MLLKLKGDHALTDKRIFKTLAFLGFVALTVAVVLGWADGAWAAGAAASASASAAAGTTTPTAAGAQSLGDIFCNLTMNALPFGGFAELIAYASGAFFTVQSIHHLRMHADSPQNNPISRGLMLALGAGLLLSLPATFSTIVTSLYGTPSPGGAISCVAMSPGSSAGTLDVMLTNFVNNISQPLQTLISAIAIVSGVAMIAKGLMKAGRHSFDPKAHSVQVILSNLVFGALLMTIGTNFTMVLASVFGTKSLADASSISWTFANTLAGGSSAQFQAAVQAGMTFVQLIGTIAFVRGWLVMKKVVDGAGNVTPAQGFTHIVGGVMAMNIYAILKIMDATFGTGLLS